MILICSCAALALLAGCRSSDDSAAVVATTGIAADITRHVAGPDMEVDSLLPGSTSAHGYSASAKDRAELENAELVVAFGSGLEEGLPLDGLDVYELAKHDEDPHVWMDPTFIISALPGLAEALAEADPEHREGYMRRADEYARELRALDEEVLSTLAGIPPAKRKLVTSHDSLGHFADHYDFEFVGAPFGLTPESEASASKVSDLIDAVEREDVPAVFAEDSDNPEILRRIASETGAEVVDDLLIESFGDDVDSYEKLLLHDARRIAVALDG
jgi:ABC-type Zn uptake system ZnuABC Zn-binding protein ZnuA